MKCHDCGKKAKTTSCHKNDKSLVKICKDCCINALGGHKCSWWNLCHGCW